METLFNESTPLSVLSLAERYRQIRRQSEQLCTSLEAEDFVVQPIIDVSPPKWHLGHTTWFFEEMILQHQPGYTRFHPRFAYVFNSYYNTVGDRVERVKRGNLTRPTVKEVMAYRRHVDEHMLALLEAEKLSEGEREVLELGFQHEQQHQELLLYDIKYILGNNPLYPTYLEADKADVPEARPASWLSVSAGLYEVGCSETGFCFDNELGVHKVYLEDFRIQDRLVTNAEYLEFIEAGGYKNFRWWLSEAWDWLKAERIEAPSYWHKQEGKWYRYGLRGGLLPLQLNEPVSHISFYEADAYAKWRGLRLPTEFEWEVACRTYSPQIPAEANFLDTAKFNPEVPKAGNPQFYGDLWEWTGSAYRPYPRFQEPEGAVGEYNGKFMINQMVLRGGSCATARDHIRPSYRNFFSPQLRWLFSGIRLAEYL